MRFIAIHCSYMPYILSLFSFSFSISCFQVHFLNFNFRFENLQKAVEKQTKILSSNQIYFFNSRRLTDIINADECVSMYPVTSEDTPFLLIPCNQPNWETIEFKPPFPCKLYYFFFWIFQTLYSMYMPNCLLWWNMVHLISSDTYT